MNLKHALLGFILIFFTNSAMSAGKSIEIDSQLFFDGKKIGSPRIFAKTGERAKIIMNDQKQSREYNLEVYPVQKANEKIELHYNLSMREKKQ